MEASSKKSRAKKMSGGMRQLNRHAPDQQVVQQWISDERQRQARAEEQRRRHEAFVTRREGV